MAVELAKMVHGRIIQRARFTITGRGDADWRVVVIVHHDAASQDDLQVVPFASEAEALAHVHARLVSHFLTFSPAELTGAEVAWEVAAYGETLPAYLDLATLVATEVEEALAEELAERETEELRRRGEPITWGAVDETGQFTLQYTEYPGQDGRPTRVVYADGRVLCVNDAGDLVDEHGQPVTEDEDGLPPDRQ